MLRAGEGTEETSEHQLKTTPRFLRRQFCHGQLFPDDEFEFGYEVDHQLAIRAHRLEEGVLPFDHLRFALHQNLTHQHLECLSEGRVRYVALVLVKLPCSEKPPRRNQHLVQLIHHGGFADSRVSRNQHQLGGTLRHHSVDRREQRINFALPSVELLGYEQSVRRVLRSQCKWIDATL